MANDHSQDHVPLLSLLRWDHQPLHRNEPSERGGGRLLVVPGHEESGCPPQEEVCARVQRQQQAQASSCQRRRAITISRNLRNFAFVLDFYQFEFAFGQVLTALDYYMLTSCAFCVFFLWLNIILFD